MASISVLPLNNYANGTRQSSALDLASDVTSVLFNVQRCTAATPDIWPNASTQLQIIPEVSQDAGVTWIEAGKSTSIGGVAMFNGHEQPFTLSGGSLPVELNGVTRKYRVSTIITGGPLRTSATVEVN